MKTAPKDFRLYIHVHVYNKYACMYTHTYIQFCVYISLHSLVRFTRISFILIPQRNPFPAEI